MLGRQEYRCLKKVQPVPEMCSSILHSCRVSELPQQGTFSVFQSNSPFIPYSIGILQSMHSKHKIFENDLKTQIPFAFYDASASV